MVDELLKIHFHLPQTQRMNAVRGCCFTTMKFVVSLLWWPHDVAVVAPTADPCNAVIPPAVADAAAVTAVV